MFRGCYTAVVTPMKDGQVDFPKFGELIERQLEGGVDGIVPAGTTGESATLTHDEHHKVVEFTIKAVDGRAKVIAGAGSNSTSEAVSLTKAAQTMGADGILSIQPYYNKPTSEGTFRHFEAVSEATDLPIVIYSVPSRTGREIDLKTVERLAEIDNIQFIKEAGGSVDRASWLAAIDGIDVLSGDDALTLPMISIGAVGVISVVSNVVPRLFRDMVHLALKDEISEARKIHFSVQTLISELFVENNPMGVKTAMKLMGLMNGEVREPLCELEPANEVTLSRALKELELI